MSRPRTSHEEREYKLFYQRYNQLSKEVFKGFEAAKTAALSCTQQYGTIKLVRI